MPKTGAGGYGLCSPWRQCWFMRHWCKRNCLEPVQLNLFSTTGADVFVINIPTCLNHPFMTKRWPAGWTCFKRIIICRLNRMHWKRVDSSSVGGYGLCLQWRQCWFELHPCKRHCPSQSSKICSVPPGEQIYSLSVFYTWLEKEQPFRYDTTKTDRLKWFLKGVPNVDPT